MLAVTYSIIRNKLKDYCNQATDNHETVIVTRKGEKNVVIMSLEKYNQLEKAARNADYLAMIDRGITQCSMQSKIPRSGRSERLFWGRILRKNGIKVIWL